jgi:SM-20-related protein
MTDSMALRLNPNLDPASFAEIFQRDGVVQIPVFLMPEDADSVATAMNGLTWNIVAPDEKSETLVISPQAIQQFGEAQVRQFLQGAIKRASRGFSFVHLSYAMQDEYGRDPTPPIHRATELLQSRDFLDLGAAVIGSDQVDGVRVQASNYRPGDFLTLHDDRHKHSVAPVAAYAATKRLSLTGWLVREPA